jgi:hypothetical protein
MPLSKDVFYEYDQLPMEKKPIQVIEAYTTKDDAYNYTLLRVASKVRESSMQLFMDYVKDKYNIKNQYITGYETVDGVSDASVDGSVELKPMIKIIIQHYYEGHKNLLEPFIKERGQNSRGVFQSLNAKYPIIKSFISSLTSENEPMYSFQTINLGEGPALVENVPAQELAIPEISEDIKHNETVEADAYDQEKIKDIESVTGTKRSRSVDADSMLEFILRQEKRQTLLDNHLADENRKETERIIAHYQQIIAGHESEKQTMEAKIQELTSKNNQLIRMIEQTIKE